METRSELEERVKQILNDIGSEVDCRAGELFDGELCDALRYVDELTQILEQLNDDNYSLDEDEE